MREWVTDREDDEDAVRVISNGVLQHGRALSESVGGKAEPIACMAMENGSFIAGATGRTEFQRLFVSYLWVDSEWRGTGLGAQALHRLEALALERGCRDALIETLDEGVAAWYVRCGYLLIGHVSGYCGPWSRHTLVKPLIP